MYELVKRGCVYILRVGPKEFVDASKPTRINLARYINHSCDPDAVVELWQTPEGKSRALIISKKDIYPDEEITINYGRHQLFRWVTVVPDSCCSDYCQEAQNYAEREGDRTMGGTSSQREAEDFWEKLYIAGASGLAKKMRQERDEMSLHLVLDL
ncbi:hypothetical protein B0H13DRAFT_1853349 [Mycena leptocephala]|nr:hypothetical protein B0H13DRAFT_1853349 [Mycena leptocephala]